MNKESIQQKITDIESAMNSPDFWNDKDKAQAMLKEYQELKDALVGVNKYDKGGAVVTISSGAGGDDAEDFVRMLLGMYQAVASNHNWIVNVLDQSQNSHGGYKSISIELVGKNIYKQLKFEAGVHRLVRISPFNANGKRQTSFALVEVMPVLDDIQSIQISNDDLQIEFTKSGGPGGQNVNKRETAVRITHTPTGITTRVTTERTQEANRQKALQIIASRVAALQEAQREEEIKNLSIGNKVKVEWGSQMRSYVMHPYQLVKDHRTNVEIRNIAKVLEGGEIEVFTKDLK